MLISYCQTPIGRLGIIADENAISRILWEGEATPALQEEGETALHREVTLQLQAYFSKKLKDFNLPLKPLGTAFQQSVWLALLDIPYGSTVSYQQIAESIGNPKACRAVGLANSRNPLPIVIPCHRVIGKNGSLTGFGGGISIKQKLLALEQEP